MILKGFLTYKMETVGTTQCSNLKDEARKKTKYKEFLLILIVRPIFF